MKMMMMKIMLMMFAQWMKILWQLIGYSIHYDMCLVIFVICNRIPQICLPLFFGCCIVICCMIDFAFLEFSFLCFLFIFIFCCGSFWGFSVRLTPLINAGSSSHSLCILQFVALQSGRKGRGKGQGQSVVLCVVRSSCCCWWRCARQFEIYDPSKCN